MECRAITHGLREDHELRKTRVLPVQADSLGTFCFSDVQSFFLGDWDLDLDHNAQETRNLLEAAKLLQESDVPVAFPTETVYGLGADATRSAAVQGIFKAKQRPIDNPLIVHICSLSQLRGLLRTRKAQLEIGTTHNIEEDDPIPTIYHPLIQRFWPGPLTILLPLPTPSPLAPEVNAALATFGARMPSSRLALALIHLANRPLAAPSANASTKPSPTTAQHVLHDLSGRIDVILDGGPCDVGVESTVVDGLCKPPAILRPGGISIEQLRACPLWENVAVGYSDGAGMGKAPRAPGMKYKHYSPRAKVVLVETGVGQGELSDLITQYNRDEGEKSVGLIRTGCWEALPATFPSGSSRSGSSPKTGDNSCFAGEMIIHDISLGKSAASVAHGLFSALRELDLKGVDVIFVEGIDASEGGEAAAVMNRLRKAAEVEIRA